MRGGLVENHVSARVFARSNPRQINQPRKTLLPSSQWRWLHPVPFPLPRDKGCAGATVPATCLEKKKKKKKEKKYGMDENQTAQCDFTDEHFASSFFSLLFFSFFLFRILIML